VEDPARYFHHDTGNGYIDGLSVTRRAQETKANEALFHDLRLEAGDFDQRAPQGKYYWTVQYWDDRFWDTVQRYAIGKRVLEIGCFNGHRTVEIASLAREVVAIDIAPRAIEITASEIKKHRCSNVTVLLGDAEQLQFNDETMDAIFCTGVIHHVDVERSLGEIYRVLAPGGHAIFREPLAHNPLVKLYRALTPKARTVDEHPLKASDLDVMKKLFGKAHFDYFGMLALLSTPLRNSAAGPYVRHALLKIDELLFNNRWLGKYCWQVNVVLEKRETQARPS
jgi:ubiquinone/menaquinone biosynthesis C-methylase UbiE